ncbi:MAG: Nucleosomal histone H3-Lys79 methylase [Watsoniomyces obsoletus]|nr:MAG: Nucleosomal histone H3-Lys79 methylase [Watsoniomyces obsoletus]
MAPKIIFPKNMFEYLRPKAMAPLKVEPRVAIKIHVEPKLPAIAAKTIKKSTSSSKSPHSQTADSKAKRYSVKRYAALPEKSSASPAANKRNVRKRPARAAVLSSDSESTDAENTQPRKKRKSSESTKSMKRQVRYHQDKEGSEKPTESIKHAQEVVSGYKPGTYENGFNGDGDMVVELHYPGDMEAEKYLLVRPKDEDNFDPVVEILRVASVVPKFYLDAAQAKKFIDERASHLRNMKRAVTTKSLDLFRSVLTDYNKDIKALYDEGAFTKSLDKMGQQIPLQLVDHILTQIYARTVSLGVQSLRKYENGTDNVYGEILPRFASKIFKDTELTHDKIFIDLGSGVGNVVLQAALEIGCDSWGCEIMENASDLAALQEKEFRARCRLWGLSTGEVHLERGDFLTNSKIREMLPKADVILVNNQAFTPELNDKLVNLFLDLKEGCRIVSLKSFIPQGHKITKRNVNSALNMLDVEEEQYFSDCVSWTDSPGEYFVAKKDSRKLKAFMKKAGLGA